MKFRFRVTLLTLLIGLVLLAVGTVGVAAVVYSRSAAEGMGDEILDQTARRVDQRVDKLLGEAVEETELAGRLMHNGQLKGDDFPHLVAYGKEALAVNPDVVSLYFGRGDTGECVGVTRLKGPLSVWQSTRNPAGRLEQREYWVNDYPARPYLFDPADEPPDIRTRPWFHIAEVRRRSGWTDTFVFLGLEGLHTVFGLTYSVPVYAPNGRLATVVSADFDLDGLCRFLKDLHVGSGGFAFIVELQADGQRRVIAHPQSELLLRPVPGGGPTERELMPVDQVEDERVREFLHALPSPSELAASPTDGRLRFTAGGEGFLAGYRRLTGDDRPRWLIGTVLPEREVLRPARRTGQLTVLVIIVALAFAIIISILVAGQVAEPLEKLAKEAAAIGQFRLDDQPAVRSFVVEVDRLGTATEEMKAGLRSFGKYVPTDLVRALVASGVEARLGGERRPLTLFFSDIAGFTALAETVPEEELVAHLGEYFGALSAEIVAQGGTLDKYIGDAIMAFWGAPAADPDHAAAACRAALRCQQRLRELRPAWRAAGRPLCPTRIGLHTGEVIVGNIGSAARLNYTAIGDAVNLASRLEGLNKRYGTECLASEETVRQAGPAIVVRPVDWVAVVGRAAGVLVYELLGVAGEVDAKVVAVAETYTRALYAYRARQWDEALALCRQVLELNPEDGPTQVLMARCAEYRSRPPEDGWDGVHRETSK